MRKFNLDPTRKQWRKAYRLARQPDKFLADPMILDFPVRYLLIAIALLDERDLV